MGWILQDLLTHHHSTYYMLVVNGLGPAFVHFVNVPCLGVSLRELSLQ